MDIVLLPGLDGTGRLYLQGKRDRLVGARGVREIKRALPSVEVRLLEAPHLILQTRPREAADAVVEFLTRRREPGNA